MGNRRVFVWRHGRTEFNAGRRFHGQADAPLDDAGRVQARSSAALLATFAPDLIVSSDLTRAADTAAALGALAGRPVQLSKGLRERSLGAWEGLTREQVQDRYAEEFAQWLAGTDNRPGGGETRHEVTERAMAAFAELPEVDTVVLVTHSATAIALTNGLLGLPEDAHIIGPLANAHWTEFGARSSGAARWRLRAHNIGPAGPVTPLLAMDAAPDAPDTAEINQESL